MKTIDESLPHLAEIESTYAHVKLWQGNEAETRRKVIDQMLTEVLGWHPVKDMTYEERNVAVGTGEIQFADYVVRTASTAFLVEAKRAGVAFELPQNRKTGKLSGFLSLGQVGDAIRQATSYARELSVPFAVVTNGSSWIVFPSVRTDGVKFEDSQAVIFRDLADVKERFVDFWELLSRQRVAEGNLEATLLRNFADQPHRRLLSVIRDSGFRLGRNSVFEHIEPAVNAAFTNEMILSDTEGLKFCYVKTSERVKYDRRVQMHIGDTRCAGEISLRPSSVFLEANQSVQPGMAFPPLYSIPVSCVLISLRVKTQQRKCSLPWPLTDAQPRFPEPTKVFSRFRHPVRHAEVA